MSIESLVKLGAWDGHHPSGRNGAIGVELYRNDKSILGSNLDINDRNAHKWEWIDAALYDIEDAKDTNRRTNNTFQI